MKPTFIGIGAQKCASSWIYNILADHPEVLISSKKELDFFSYWYDHGFEWYERHFPSKDDIKAVGEISPSYFHDPRAPVRVSDYSENMKIILTLRNPVERAYSQHKHEVQIGTYIGPNFTFEAGLRQNPGYIYQGLYATHLNNWLKYFPMSQVLVVLFDDVETSPNEVAKRVYRFLDLNDTHRSDALDKVSNPSYIVRSRLVDVLTQDIRTAAISLRMNWAWKLLARSPVRSAYRAMNRKESRTIIPPMLKDTERNLNDIFQSEILRLENTLRIDLSSWIRV